MGGLCKFILDILIIIFIMCVFKLYFEKIAPKNVFI